MNLELIKKVALFISFGVWAVLIFKIFQAGGSMNEQLPKCIFTTITIFAILTAIVKILEYLDKKN